MSITRTRGFQFISKKQWEEDIPDLPYLMNEQDFAHTLPVRGTKGSAGYDFPSLFDFTLAPTQELLIPTGIRVYMPQNEFLMCVPRSGHGFKYYARLANTAGIIDSDYYNAKNDGHIWLKIRNESEDKILSVNCGQGIMQGIFIQYHITDDDNFSEGKTRTGGFGSTG